MKTSIGNTPEVVNKTASYSWVNVVLGVIFLVGIYAWSRELGGNPGATNLSDYAPWGLYISFFLFFEALAAGTLFIVALGGIYKSLPIPRIKLLLIGLVSAVCAGLAILPDLGSPLGAWRLIFSPNFSSPMIMDVWFLGLMIVIGTILWWAISKENTKIERFTSYVLGLIAVLLPMGTAWLFTTFPGKIAWMSPLEIAVFLLQAGLAGACILFLIQKFSKIQSDGTIILIFSFLVANLFLVIGEIGYTLFNTGTETLPFMALISGPYKSVFWILVLLCLVLPCILILSKKYIVTAACLGITGIILSKYLFIVKGNHFPFLHQSEGVDIPYLMLGTDGYQSIPFYFPSWEEWLVALGILAFGTLLLNLGYRKINKG